LGSPNFSSYIYLPLEYERRFNRSFSYGGWRGVLYESFYSSLLRIPFTYTLESFDGPGYLGYLFFMVYDMVLIHNVYKAINVETGLGRDGDSFVRRFRPRIIRSLRGSFTQLELEFMRRYGVDINSLLRGVGLSSFNYPIDIHHLRLQFKSIVSSITDESSWYRMDSQHFIRILSRLMRMGISLSIQHVYRYMEHLLFLSKIDDYIESYDFIPSISPIELYYRLARRLGMDYLVENDLYRYRMELFTTSPVYRMDGDLLRGDLGRCKYILIAGRLANIYKSRDISRFLRINCKLCSYTLGSYIMRSKHVDTEVRIRNGRCSVMVSQRTGLGEDAYEAT